jgi:hypothetical protein
MLFGGNERREKEREMQQAGRLPPGQSLTLKWPILHEGSVPRFDPARWDFRVFGLVEKPIRLSWDEFNRLPMREVVADMHCVTRWSRFDVRWEGVPFSEVARLAGLKPEAHFVLVHADQGYTANVPLEDLMRPPHSFRSKAQWRAAARRPWLSRAAGCSASLRLEKCEVGPRNRIPAARRPRILGTKRLPHLWRPLEGTALYGKLARYYGISGRVVHECDSMGIS